MKDSWMALDRSPESFSPQNEFYIFVPLVPTCDPRANFDPKGHHMKKKLTKVYKEMLHTENLSSISSSFREEEF